MSLVPQIVLIGLKYTMFPPNEVNLSGWSIKDTAATPIHEFSEEKISAGGLVICRRLTG